MGSRILQTWMLTVALLATGYTQTAIREPANPDTGEEAKAQILEMERDLEHALATNDIETLERIYSDDYVYINAGGELLDKQRFLADLRSQKHKILEVKHDELRLHVYENTVVVTGVSESKFEYKGLVTVGPRRFTNVYVRQQGRWKLALHAVTDIKAH